jgi:hypothetical protein
VERGVKREGSKERTGVMKEERRKDRRKRDEI